MFVLPEPARAKHLNFVMVSSLIMTFLSMLSLALLELAW